MEVVALLCQGRTAAAQCGFFTYKSVPVIFEPPCICLIQEKVYLTSNQEICENKINNNNNYNNYSSVNNNYSIIISHYIISNLSQYCSLVLV